jgi:hypothetical protein
MNKGYRLGKYTDKPVRYNSYGVTVFKPPVKEKETNIELPFVILSILIIIVVVIASFPL